jgi:Transmembrane amino acid transporter protein
VNVLCGVGLLSAPYAIKQGGWLGLIILFLFGTIAFYTGILLRKCLDSEQGLQTYPDIGQAAFGTYGRVAISVRHLPLALFFIHPNYENNSGFDTGFSFCKFRISNWLHSKLCSTSLVQNASLHYLHRTGTATLQYGISRTDIIRLLAYRII